MESIGDDTIAVVEKLEQGGDKIRQFAPVDVLRKGEVLERVSGRNAYRWTDVKQGDTVRLQVLTDEGDGVTYCLEISIRRRPGGKLPESQNPEDDYEYARERIQNDIENGEDISDSEIDRLLPKRPLPDPTKGFTGGLTRKHREMLEANRKRIAEEKEKKDKELKAKPVTDKSDPKKDDKK